MVGSRTATAAVGLLASVAVSLALYWYVGVLVGFLFVPFVPFLFANRGSGEERDPEVRSCPRCGFETVEERYEYCPRDGTRLDRERSAER